MTVIIIKKRLLITSISHQLNLLSRYTVDKKRFLYVGSTIVFDTMHTVRNHSEHFIFIILFIPTEQSEFAY